MKKIKEIGYCVFEYCTSLTSIVIPDSVKTIGSYAFCKCSNLKNIELSEVLKYDLPYANEYEGFWNKPLTLQHPLSKIEIVPCDSSLTLFLSKDKKLVNSFMSSFPYSENLEDYLEK